MGMPCGGVRASCAAIVSIADTHTGLIADRISYAIIASAMRIYIVCRTIIRYRVSRVSRPDPHAVIRIADAARIIHYRIYV